MKIAMNVSAKYHTFYRRADLLYPYLISFHISEWTKWTLIDGRKIKEPQKTWMTSWLSFKFSPPLCHGVRSLDVGYLIFMVTHFHCQYF